MARHDARLRRLVTQLKGSHVDLRAARLARMTDEELQAEAVRLAMKLGLDVEQAPASPESLRLWADGHVPEWAEELSEEELTQLRGQLAQHLEWRSQHYGQDP